MLPLEDVNGYPVFSGNHASLHRCCLPAVSGYKPTPGHAIVIRTSNVCQPHVSTSTPSNSVPSPFQGNGQYERSHLQRTDCLGDETAWLMTPGHVRMAFPLLILSIFRCKMYHRAITGLRVKTAQYTMFK